jgi:hypothetical protein
VTLKRLCILAALAVLLFLPASSFACTACRDMTAGSPPQVRAGLERGILVLGIPAGLVFVGILVLALKMKPQERSSREEAASRNHFPQA